MTSKVIEGHIRLFLNSTIYFLLGSFMFKIKSKLTIYILKVSLRYYNSLKKAHIFVRTQVINGETYVQYIQ